jgi:hypothetical protein
LFLAVELCSKSLSLEIGLATRITSGMKIFLPFRYSVL